MFAPAGVTGNPAGAASLRSAFHTWIAEHIALSEEQLSDLTLAVNEALANAVEHAYAGAADPGQVDLHARFDPRTGTLTATVRDQGNWRNPAPDPMHLRGRGIPLMRALATTSTIASNSHGTSVELRWEGIAARAS